MGCIVPSGIATDDTTKFFFQHMMDGRRLVSLYDFENRRKLFPGIDSRIKFCLLTLTGHGRPALEGSDFVFFALEVADLREEEKHFTLTPEEIALINPNTRTCPIFRTKRDAELTKAIYRRVPVLIKEGPPEENPWGIEFLRMFDVSNASELFVVRDALEGEGLRPTKTGYSDGKLNYHWMYEGRLGHQFNHRYATERDGLLRELSLEELADPDCEVNTQYLISASEVHARLSGRVLRCRSAFLGHRRVARNTDERTSIACVMPSGPIANSWILTLGPSAADTLLLCAAYNSFVYDYCLRNATSQPSIPQSTSMQVPVPSRGSIHPLLEHLTTQIAIELSFTSWALSEFAREAGYGTAPYRWDEERRFLLRCELDAAFFHLYLPATPDGRWRHARIGDGAVRDETPEELAELSRHFPASRDAVAYIMDTFPIVRRHDEEGFGEYRTKRVVLEIYDEMQRAIDTGLPYQTRLDPPPADPRVAHRARDA